MSQFSIFFVPVKGDERSEEALNLCLRTRRVLQVERHVFPDGWTFCVEWLDGEGGVKGLVVKGCRTPEKFVVGLYMTPVFDIMDTKCSRSRAISWHQ